MGHSPGPWKWAPAALYDFTPYKPDGELQDSNGSPVLWGECTNDAEVAWIAGGGDVKALIASAPEMLALLQKAARDLASEWLANHDEHCGNVPLSKDAPEVFHRKGAKCCCPAPNSLGEIRALLARLKDAGVTE